jgi:hypothetical protein
VTNIFWRICEIVQRGKKITKHSVWQKRNWGLLFVRLINYPRADGAKRRARVLIPPGETKALAESKVHQISRAWVTNRGWSSSLISNIWRTVMNSGHWLVQYKMCIITTAWRQRNSKHFLIWWLMNFLPAFLQDFVNFKSFLIKKGRKNRLKKGSRR